MLLSFAYAFYLCGVTVIYFVCRCWLCVLHCSLVYVIICHFFLLFMCIYTYMYVLFSICYFVLFSYFYWVCCMCSLLLYLFHVCVYVLLLHVVLSLRDVLFIRVSVMSVYYMLYVFLFVLCVCHVILCISLSYAIRYIYHCIVVVTSCLSRLLYFVMCPFSSIATHM